MNHLGRRRTILADEIHQYLCDASDSMLDMMRECKVTRGDPIITFRQRLEALLDDFESEFDIGNRSDFFYVFRAS